MSTILRHVELPTGERAIEVEYEMVGGSETQLSYDYILGEQLDGVKLRRECFKRDYWGRIEGIVTLPGVVEV